jgi:hypothetical protein
MNEVYALFGSLSRVYTLDAATSMCSLSKRHTRSCSVPNAKAVPGGGVYGTLE